jgi:hypothetical protein
MSLRFISRCCLCLTLLVLVAAHTVVVSIVCSSPSTIAMIESGPRTTRRAYQQWVAAWEEKIIVPNEPIPEIVEPKKKRDSNEPNTFRLVKSVRGK